MKNVFQLFTRFKDNPILTTQDLAYSANSIFNPGAVKFNGKTLLLCRVEDRRGFSHLTKATSKNGQNKWKIDEKPTFLPSPEGYPEEIWGVEDPRITYLEELNQYAVCYTAYSKRGPLISLALTQNFEEFERKGAIMPPEDKDAAFFPCKFNNSWLLIHRPMPSRLSQGAHIWLSSSPDLIHWGKHKVLMEARNGGWWDSHKIGLGAQPIKTKDGWLIIYHGVRKNAAGSIYRLGLALLDLENPFKIICRPEEWILAPEQPYEMTGEVENVIFTCGAVCNEREDELKVYYGASDTSICLLTARVDDILEYLKTCKQKKGLFYS